MKKSHAGSTIPPTTSRPASAIPWYRVPRSSAMPGGVPGPPSRQAGEPDPPCRGATGTDPLTGVPNRRAFLQRLRAATEQARGSSPAVVCLIDLDGFKGVDDREGHAAGDAV